ncbi:MAG: hypothetical protein Q3994_00030 [Prevotella sp.]|nr:hypothetical protein [Prevotella sp.]
MKNEEEKLNQKGIIGWGLYGLIGWQVVLLIYEPSLLWYCIAVNVLILIFFMVSILRHIKQKWYRKAIVSAILGMGVIVVSYIDYFLVTNF